MNVRGGTSVGRRWSRLPSPYTLAESHSFYTTSSRSTRFATPMECGKRATSRGLRISSMHSKRSQSARCLLSCCGELMIM